jgi:predicted aminopeptidase
VRRAALALVVIAAVGGCFKARYVGQAALGQADLLVRARPIDEVIRDPSTPVRTAMVLAEIGSIKTYGRSYGLELTSKYTKYTKLDRRAAVWFVGASSPVRFEPLKWCFPIAGCFQGLGWFDEEDALDFEADLKKQGLDTVERGASAYSTGKFFPDPLLSTMIGGGDDTLPYFANTVLHESVHATVLVPDEPPFNESIAQYIADVLTDDYIRERFGPGSPEDVAWTFGQALGRARTVRVSQTYKELKALYAQKLPDKDTLAKKAAIIDALVADLKLHSRPNNATLGESNVYNGGLEPLHDAHVACGDIKRFIAAAKTIKRDDFTKDLQDDLAPVAALIARRCRESR